MRPPALPGVRVLAVDDNADALEVLTTALANAGADVVTATTGTGAVEQWKRAPADVLICDLAIPGIDGFRVMQIIREPDAARGHRAFAVALSAYTSDDYVERAREAGFDRHVGKPFDPAKLMSEVAEALVARR